jgi:hypothetical protein
MNARPSRQPVFDRHAPGSQVVTDRVVEQIGDQPFGQRRVAAR